MKRFAIISTVLILISAGVFGFSLSYYLNAKDAPPVKAAPVEETVAPTEDPGADLTLSPDAPQDNGIFAAYYEKAAQYVAGMSTEQMVGQVIVGVLTDASSGVNDINRYSLGGVLFAEEAFDYMSKDECKSAIDRVRAAAPVAPIIAAQEEGGRVNTLSSHSAFEDVTFESNRNLYESGGLAAVERQEDEKTTLLREYGFNVNVAPVLDLAKEYDQIMYSRSLCGDAQVTSTFAEYVAKFNQAKGVSVVLKHFPGYGTINDTTDSPVVDTRDAATIRSEDYQPFKAGADAGAHFVMMSNVVVQSIDPAHTAALSPTLHRELRDSIGFSGLIITDVLDGADYSAYSDGKDPVVTAILAGNDLILVKDCAAAYNTLLSAVGDGTISSSILQQLCTRIVAYKYATGLMK